MMSRQHALTGCVAWLAAYEPINALTGLTPAQAVIGAAATTGAALLPDWDQGGVKIKRRFIVVPVIASWGPVIARTYGPLTASIAWCIGKAAGGHRHGTHSVVGVAAFTAAAAYATTLGGWWVAAVLWLLLGAAVRSFDLAVPGHITTTAIGHGILLAGVVFVIMRSGVDLTEVVPWAVPLGCTAHILGDMLTVEGCPLGWPWSHRMIHVASMHAGDATETRVVFPLLMVSTVALTVLVTGAGSDVWQTIHPDDTAQHAPRHHAQHPHRR